MIDKYISTYITQHQVASKNINNYLKKRYYWGSAGKNMWKIKLLHAQNTYQFSGTHLHFIQFNIESNE